MENILKNIILIIALAAVIIIIVAILLYDFIPSISTVTDPNMYSADTKTTKVLSEIADSTESLDSQNGNSSSNNSSIVLQSYSITETDLDLYAASNSYERGKADPFADIATSSGNSSGNDGTSGSTNNSNSGNTVDSNEGNNNSNSNSSSNSQNAESDGTLFNSTHTK